MAFRIKVCGSLQTWSREKWKIETVLQVVYVLWEQSDFGIDETGKIYCRLRFVSIVNNHFVETRQLRTNVPMCTRQLRGRVQTIIILYLKRAFPFRLNWVCPPRSLPLRVSHTTCIQISTRFLFYVLFFSRVINGASVRPGQRTCIQLHNDPASTLLITLTGGFIWNRFVSTVRSRKCIEEKHIYDFIKLTCTRVFRIHRGPFVRWCIVHIIIVYINTRQ